ncbi:ADP-dependent glucokinase isoform X2 [Oratosquilla oratoria]|uniref:ADP-dependent glucokinase isoform X2 n=1 Tax=Oratosquilla oratoria TaxID=337810 RepID=UPI003F7597FD
MGARKVVGAGTALSILVLLLAYWFKTEPDSILRGRLDHVLNAMLKVEKDFPVGEVRIAVGYGACKDIFAKGSQILGDLPAPENTAHYGRIETMEQLMEVYALFFAAGSAAERYISNDTLFEELVEMAEAATDSYSALGGNAPVMATRFAMEGAKVLLSAKKANYLQSQVHSNIKIAGEERSEVNDDIHLILEYKTNEVWGKYKAPRANRFIVHSDNDNPGISSAEEFGTQLVHFNPHLLVVGGLQMMDNFPFPPGVQEERLKIVRDQMAQMTPSSRVHFEMASFTDLGLMMNLAQYIIPYADSLGMNEQELPNLYSLLKYGNVSVLSDFNPRVAIVLDQMREVYKLLSQSDGVDGRRALTRLHVHTLAYQAIMVKRGSSWTNNKAAAVKAALTANRHVCGNPEIKIENARLLMDEGFSLSEAEGAGRVMFDDEQPVSCWNELNGEVEVCIAPVLVCTAVRQTAGGGDNISAAGLVLQI